MQFSVYYFFDETGELLYVGRTKNFMRRLTAHAVDTSWFRDVRKVMVEPFSANQDAIDVEMRMIAELRPRFNTITWESRKAKC